MTDEGTPQSVVVLDDNAAFCAMVQEILEEEGFLVTSCTDPRAALGAVIELQPDLVISDWWLRDPDGERLAHIIRRDPRTAHIPVLVCTADGMIRNEMEILALDGIEVIKKPFDLNDFISAVRRTLECNADTVS
jgi:CheY-like chemotaxis protein